MSHGDLSWISSSKVVSMPRVFAEGRGWGASGARLVKSLGIVCYRLVCDRKDFCGIGWEHERGGMSHAVDKSSSCIP
jgi:hypothetical protein